MYGHLGSRWLRYQHDRLRLRIVAQQVEGLQGGDAANRRVHVAAAGADGVADALAGLMQQAGDLLDTRARRANQADSPAPDDIGEPEPDAVQHGRPAIRPHHQELFFLRGALQVDLIFDRHVVGEQEHVQAVGQCLAGFAGRILPRHRDHCQIGFRIGAMGAAQRSGRATRRFTRRAAASPTSEQRFGLLQRRGRQGIVDGPHGDDQVVWPGRWRITDEQARIAQQLAVQLAGHDQRGVPHTR